MSFLNDNSISKTTHQNFPHWYSPHSGIHRSTHRPIPLPKTPFHDVVSHLFAQNDTVVSSSPALIDAASGSATTYSDLRRRVESLSAALQSLHNLAKDDVVLCLLPNCTNYPVVLLSVLRSGAVVSTMNPLSSAAEIGKQVRDCKPVIAFATAERVEALKQLGLVCFAVPTESNGRETESDSDFDKMLKFSGSKLKKPAIKLDDTAAIMYSSGTTGESKGVVLTHRNLIAMIELFVRFEASQYEEHYSSDCVYLAVLPMFHIYGMSLFVMGLLSLGVTVVVMKRFDAGEAVRAVEKFRVTHFPVVPPVLVALTRVPVAERRRLTSLRQVSSGAAPLSGKAIEDFVQAFPHVDFIQGYGMTESTAVGTRGFNTKKLKNFCSIGLLAPNTEAKVVDWNSGTFLPPGGVGELWLRGPAIMKGYLNNEAATRSTIDEDGWLRTGDIVYFDQDGYLYIVDRLKEIIKYKGFQIAPADLEAVLASHPEILDVAVAGVSNEGSGEMPVAFIIRKNGSSISEEVVMDYVAKQVAPYKKIRRVVFTPSIPKSPAGKILRRELKRSLSSKL